MKDQLTDTTGKALPPRETPSDEMRQTMGDFLFLAFRSPHHQKMPVANLRLAFEPPIVFGQHQVFRFDGIPRGLFTWAHLSRDAEKRYVAGELLKPSDWQSGTNLWIIDLIAPYRGLTTGMVRWIMQPGNLTQHDFYFRRVVRGRATRRIVHIDFKRPEGLSKIMTNDDFL